MLAITSGVTKKRGYSFDSQNKRCRVGHSENPCSHAKKVMGGVQIRLRFYLGVDPVDDYRSTLVICRRAIRVVQAVLVALPRLLVLDPPDRLVADDDGLVFLRSGIRLSRCDDAAC